MVEESNHDFINMVAVITAVIGDWCGKLDDEPVQRHFESTLCFFKNCFVEVEKKGEGSETDASR